MDYLVALFKPSTLPRLEPDSRAFLLTSPFLLVPNWIAMSFMICEGSVFLRALEVPPALEPTSKSTMLIPAGDLNYGDLESAFRMCSVELLGLAPKVLDIMECYLTVSRVRGAYSISLNFYTVFLLNDLLDRLVLLKLWAVVPADGDKYARFLKL